MRQLILDLLPEMPPSLDNFVVGRNGEALAALAAWLTPGSRETSLLLWGEPAAGKTHLLRASGAHYCDALDDRSMTAFGHPEAAENNTTAFYAVDNVEALNEPGQNTLFNLFNRLHATGGRLLTATTIPPQQMAIREDLRTRLGSGLIYRLQPLSETEQDAALGAQAAQRGLRLPTGALAYLRRRAPRDMRSLSALLAALDRYSLEQRRPITLSLLREVLQPVHHAAHRQDH